jgi:hypothetical protein
MCSSYCQYRKFKPISFSRCDFLHFHRNSRGVMSRVAGFGHALLTEARFFSLAMPWMNGLGSGTRLTRIKKTSGGHRVPPIIFAQDIE